MDKKLLIELLKASDENVFKIIKDNLPEGYFTFEYKNSIIALPQEFDNGIALVAHTDTIRQTSISDNELIIKGNLITCKNKPLGADDRAGVFAVLEIARKSKRKPILMFFDGEERGAYGVREFVSVNPNFPDTIEKYYGKGIDLFIELDREGFNEYVYYTFYLPAEVKEYVESFGYGEDIGSFSDISVLTDEYNIPSVNLSVGYKFQHTKREILSVSILNDTIKNVAEMCSNPIGKLYPVDSYSDEYDIVFDDYFIDLDNPAFIQFLRDMGYIDTFGNCEFCQMPYSECTCGSVEDAYAEYLHFKMNCWEGEQLVRDPDLLQVAELSK